METIKTLSIAGDYKKLEEKLLELTKDDLYILLNDKGTK